MIKSKSILEDVINDILDEGEKQWKNLITHEDYNDVKKISVCSFYDKNTFYGMEKNILHLILIIIDQ